ncbi:hypothetical protein D3C71_1701770 [compost metagenome]
MLFQIGFKFFEVLERNDARTTCPSIEPVLNNDRTSSQCILDFGKACFGKNLGSFLSPIVGGVAIRNSFHSVAKSDFLDSTTPRVGRVERLLLAVRRPSGSSRRPKPERPAL